MKSDYPASQFIKDYWWLLKGRRLEFIFFSFLRLISGIAYFGVAYAISQIIDFFTYYDGGPLDYFYWLVLAILVMGVGQVFLRFYAKIKMQTIAADIRKEIRVDVMSRLVNYKLKWHESEETGSKLQKINSGGDAVFQGLKDLSNYGMRLISNFVGSLVLFLALEPRYFLYAILYSIIYLAGEYYFNVKISYSRDQMNKVKEKLSGKFHESISNILTVKTLGLKKSFNKTTIDYEQEYYNAWWAYRDITRTKAQTIKVFSAIAFGVFVLFVGLDFISASITLGAIYLYIDYFSKLRVAVEEVSNNSSDFISVKSAFGRFMSIYRIDAMEKDGKKEVSKNWKEIEFKDVWFRYKNKWVLKDFNLKIKRNEKIGIVGVSGSGKSTFVQLLLRLYQPEKGSIMIDGIDISKFRHSSLTRLVSVVLQDSEMFNLSLFDNICISAKKNMILFDKAVMVSQLKTVIKKLPQGIHTLIGEKGYKLSGGERQRVGIARALYKNTSLLVLDEATSSLDSKTEKKIQSSLENSLKKKTVIVIAHRLSTLEKMRRVIVMDKGKIVEEGSFKQLIKNKGLFSKLYSLQRKK